MGDLWYTDTFLLENFQCMDRIDLQRMDLKMEHWKTLLYFQVIHQAGLSISILAEDRGTILVENSKQQLGKP